ncbi:hypothetical protein F5144DRAFT_357491 [Chaetomium tenue]|uniref:Uncharacterized protein n=1 Tax=Chaetomium tenue TaxID=1854479 RepID=A0ACB7NY94_9PEZI|nr:hypothetical protein F5144DRAFT_357491 [Chaetomium globosum]
MNFLKSPKPPKPPPLPNRDFHFIPIPNTPAHPPPLTLTHTTTWTYCGPLLPISNPPATPTATSLPPTFHTWCAHTLTPTSAPHLLPLLTPLLHAIHTFLRQHHRQHYWLTLRATQPTDTFDTPRWHADDDFFDPARSDAARGRWKLCATLQGPGTLFAVEGGRARGVLRRVKEKGRRAERERPHVCPGVRCVACGRTSEVVREEVRVGLEREGVRVVQPGSGEMVFFRLGGREGAVHSEPRIDCDRVFVNVVPGTEEELRGLMGRWGMGFPRSWSLGVPMVVGGEGGGEDGDREDGDGEEADGMVKV